MRGKWYGLVEKIEITTGTSGTYKVKIETELLNKKEFDEMLKDILTLIRAPESVENEI